MRRRDVLLGSAAVAATAPHVALAAGAADGAPAPVPALIRLKFAPLVHDQLTAIVRAHGIGSPGYDPDNRPYAVFDWDNTSIMNDCEETCLVTLIDTFAFRMSPAEFSVALRNNVPGGQLADGYQTIEGRPVTFEALAADLEADYAALAADYGLPMPTEKAADLAKDDRFLAFKSKLWFAYNAVIDTFGEPLGDVWVIGFLTGFTLDEVQALALANNEANLGRAMQMVTFATPESHPGTAGRVSMAHFDGLRLTPEIAAVQHYLRSSGIDVFVVSASFEDLVRVFATDPRFGYNLLPEHVHGVRMVWKDGTVTPEKDPAWPLTLGPGKSETIRKVMVAERGFGPLLVFGDSDGDYDMLRDFDTTKLGVIVNRAKGGKIGELSQLAAGEQTAEAPRFALQGRNENTGEWRPAASVLKIGTTTETLLFSAG